MEFVRSRNFEGIYGEIAEMLLTLGNWVEGSTTWQAQDISNRPEMVPLEVENVIFQMPMPRNITSAQVVTYPNLPWAEEHFLERVGGMPLNPPPSARTWPFAQAGHASHTDEWGMFSHTYPERFWPKHAGHDISGYCDDRECEAGPHSGIRFQLGDLDDVAKLLHDDPLTRQAFLPIWFPEDTGATKGQRVPCSLGYHFMIRHNKLHVTYLIRAVDFMRHFRDDVYMAIRLGQWMTQCANVEGLTIGHLTMHTMSMHCFAGDIDSLRQVVAGKARRETQRLLGAMR